MSKRQSTTYYAVVPNRGPSDLHKEHVARN